MPERVLQRSARIYLDDLLNKAQCADLIRRAARENAWKREESLRDSSRGVIQRQRDVLHEPLCPDVFSMARAALEASLCGPKAYLERATRRLSPLLIEHYGVNDQFDFHIDAPSGASPLHFVLFLNEAFECGLTILRHQPFEVQAMTGTAFIFPAHEEYRAEPVRKGDKYVLSFDVS